MTRFEIGECSGPSLVEAKRFTRRLALTHYENFIVGGLLTPKALRQDFYNVYAYCRIADDLADEVEDQGESLAGLDQWEDWLVECYGKGTSSHPLFVALRETIERFSIPREPFLQLLSAFRQDRFKNRYETLEEVVRYSASSANPVGHLVLYLGHCFSPQRARLADAICTGLQLANFWQDVRRDALIDRVYIPGESLAAFGVEISDLSADVAPEAGPRMLESLVNETEEFFQRGLPLASDVPLWLGRNIRLFAGGGTATLSAIRKARYDVWTRRPTVGKLRQMSLVAKQIFTWR